MSPLFVCNLDESGTNKESPVVTIGGYIALASAWSDFELKARSIFDAYGVHHLHGVEFQHRKPPFNTWSPIRSSDPTRARSVMRATMNGCKMV